MTGPNKRVKTAEFEAAEWHARLGAPRVSTETIEAFFGWRQSPENAEAYRRVEQVWTSTGQSRQDPAMGAAVDAAMTRKVRQRRVVQPLVFGLAGVVAAGALAVGGWLWVDGRGVYATSVGEQRSVQLADGSSVRLDTDSRVRVRFNGDRRIVELERGQALFDVAHDAGRPFVVEAGETRITAVGTVFDVRHAGEGVEVTLVSGVVEVLAAEGGMRSRMSAGHQALAGYGALKVEAVDAGVETSWADGRVVFRDTPLEDAVAEVNRYLTAPVVLDAPGLEREALNGVFKTGDRDAFVVAATATLGLKASPGPDGAVRLSIEK